MDSNNKKIVLNQGIGDLTFIMTREEVELTLGRADHVDDFIYEEPVYYYEELGLAVIFELQETDFVISSFEIEKDIYVLCDISLINKNYNEIVNLLKEKGINNYTQETYDSITKYIYYQNLCLEFEDDNMSVITLYNPIFE